MTLLALSGAIFDFISRLYLNSGFDFKLKPVLIKLSVLIKQATQKQ